jgi:hypothetical protein
MQKNPPARRAEFRRHFLLRQKQLRKLGTVHTFPMIGKRAVAVSNPWKTPLSSGVPPPPTALGKRKAFPGVQAPA